MKKCKKPKCLTQMSENSPDFCPKHNKKNLKSKDKLDKQTDKE